METPSVKKLPTAKEIVGPGRELTLEPLLQVNELSDNHATPLPFTASIPLGAPWALIWVDRVSFEHHFFLNYTNSIKKLIFISEKQYGSNIGKTKDYLYLSFLNLAG